MYVTNFDHFQGLDLFPQIFQSSGLKNETLKFNIQELSSTCHVTEETLDGHES